LEEWVLQLYKTN